MSKFSAYMRGERGSIGESGQASILDGIAYDINELPTPASDKNYVYYVKQEDGIHLYVSTTDSQQYWTDLGLITAGFSTTQFTSVTTIPWTPEKPEPTVTITPHGIQETTGLKSFDFDFGIPEGQPAGFSTTQRGSATTLAWNDTPTITIIPDNNTPNWEKTFDFNFGIPMGRPAGFDSEMNISVSTLPSTSNATVEVTPVNNTPDYAKKFDFKFGIPNGVPGGFGDINVNTQQINSDLPAEVSITASGPEAAKNFSFTFKIPKGEKGIPGDSFSVYLPLEFLSTSTDITSSIYWDNNNKLHAKRGENAKIPIYILNEQNNNIASTFEITENEIIYEGDSKFDGKLYLISKVNFPIFSIGQCTITTGDPYAELYYPNENNREQVKLNFYFPRRASASSSESGDIDILWDEIDRLEGILNVKIDEAPSDNKIYGRKNGNWTEVTGGSGPSSDNYYTKSEIDNYLADKSNISHNHNNIYSITTHTHDDRYYVKNEINSFTTSLGGMAYINDAPSDGKQYARNSGVWQEIIGSATPTGVWSIEQGGTGATTSTNALINLGAVSKSGDTMNGQLNFAINDIDCLTTSFSDSWGHPPMLFRDINNLSIGGLEVGRVSWVPDHSDSILTGIVAARSFTPKAEGEMPDNLNFLGCGIDSNSTKFYVVDAPIAFRNAIGATTEYGVWPIELGGTGISTGINWNNLNGNPFISVAADDYGNIITGTTSKYEAILLENNLIFKTNKWNVNTSTNAYYEPFIYYNDSNGEKYGEFSMVRENGNISIQMQTSQRVWNQSKQRHEQIRNAFRVGVTMDGQPFYRIEKPAAFLDALKISFTNSTTNITVGTSMSTGDIVFVYEE